MFSLTILKLPPKKLFFFKLFIQVKLTHDIALVSGVEQNDQTFVYIAKCLMSPPSVQLTSITIHYYKFLIIVMNRPEVLTMWHMYLQHQHYLETWQKCKFSCCTQEPTEPEFLEWHLTVSALRSPPGASDAHSSLRITALDTTRILFIGTNFWLS